MENKQTKIIFAVIGVVILLALTVGLSFAIWSADKSGGTNTITTGTVSMSFTESTSVINLTDALPIQDLVTAKTGSYFEFSVASTTTGASTINYNIIASLEPLDANYTSIGNDKVNLYLTKVTNSVESAPIVNALANTIITGENTSGTLHSASFTHSAAGTLTDTYRLRMWIPYNVDATNWISSTKLQYKLKLSVTATV